MVALDHLYDKFINAPSMEQGRDFPKEEYQLRIKKTRELMSKYEIDTLVVTSSVNSRYFTSNNQPHEWHDICQTRAAFYILTMDDDYLYMTPTMSGEHQNTARKRTWVTNTRSVVERFEKKDRIEIWGVEWMVKAFKELGLDNAKLGWELGDCQILGLSYNDFNEFKRLMPNAQFLDASPILRRLHQFPTPFQLERIRKACAAGVKMHEQVVDIAKIGMTEREFVVKMLERFREFKFGEGYEYRPEYNDIRNPKHPEMNLMFKSMVTERPFMEGDVFCKASSGLSYRDYHADIDRVWYIGKNPPEKVKKWYRVTYECAGAMGEALKPGNTCADVFEIDNEIAKKHGLPERLVGRNGHWSNLSGLSVHPDVKIVLEPGMVISVEPTFVEDFGYFDIEDIYLITENGSEILHKKAPEEISCCY